MLRVNPFLFRFFVLFAMLTISPLLNVEDSFGSDKNRCSDEINTESQSDRAREAAKVLGEIMRVPENGIPKELMDRADAIAVIPHVMKAALGFGGRWGKGLVSHRMDDGSWSTPSFIDISGGSFGPQIGINATDLVLVFTDHDGFKGLLRGKLKLSGEAEAAAGPLGRNASAGTDILLRSGVLAYSRSKGLFAGVSLDGSVVTIDDSGNRKVYGDDLDGEDILLRGRAKSNDVVEPFEDALNRYSPNQTARQKPQICCP